jgi:hypothetical protein
MYSILIEFTLISTSRTGQKFKIDEGSAYTY